MSAPAKRPKLLPEPTPVTQPFWEAARQHELRVQRCRECREHIFYPRALCPHCGADDPEWVRASGRGTIYSYTVARRPTMPTLECPYVIAIVELEEGPHMTTNVVDCDPEQVKVGDPVQATFSDVSDELSLVYFKPAPAG